MRKQLNKLERHYERQSILSELILSRINFAEKQLKGIKSKQASTKLWRLSQICIALDYAEQLVTEFEKGEMK